MRPTSLCAAAALLSPDPFCVSAGTIRFWASKQQRASNLTITATRTSCNNDGVDVDSSTDTVIDNLYYDGGDECAPPVAHLSPAWLSNLPR